jgi:hypothetical protein
MACGDRMGVGNDDEDELLQYKPLWHRYVLRLYLLWSDAVV